VGDLKAVAELSAGPVVVVGHSSGGGHPAYAFAARYPEVVRQLVIVDAGPGPRDPADALPPPALSPDERTSSWYTSNGFSSRDAVFAELRGVWNLRHMTDQALRDRLNHNVKQVADSSWNLRYDQALRSPSGVNMPGEDEDSHWAMLREIQCPTLIVRGAESHSVSRRKAERMAETIPDCQCVEVAKSTHWPHIENPSGFLGALTPFLAGKEPKAP
jgi:pimeloyl-ACP methyl ester carboxylesterase